MPTPLVFQHSRPPPPGSYCTVPYLFTTFCFQTEILGNLFKKIYICFILFFSSSLPCRKDQVGRFIFFYRFNCTDPGLQLGDPAPLIGLLMIMKWIIYELRKWNEKVKMNKWSSQWTQRQWLHSSVGRASHWYREVTGSNHVEVLDVFRASLRNCINCVHCDDHVLIFIFSHWFVAVDLLTFYIFWCLHYKNPSYNLSRQWEKIKASYCHSRWVFCTRRNSYYSYSYDS